MTKQAAIFLDRDGTIIENKHYLNDPGKLVYLKGTMSGLKKLSDAGYPLIVVTNQSGIPRGKISEDQLQAIHRRMQKDFLEQGFEILEYYHAPFMPDSGHPDRKPEPGMLLRAAQKHNVDLKSSWMIGDKMLDVEAGHRAGTKSLLISSEDSGEMANWAPPEAVFDNLSQCADFILGNKA